MDAEKEIASLRSLQVGSGDRSERIRTYNFSQNRVSDHRIDLTLYKLDAVMNGDLRRSHRRLWLSDIKKGRVHRERSHMKTLSEILSVSVEFFKEKGALRPRRLAEELIGHVLGIRRMDLYLQFDRPLLEEELVHLRSLAKRAIAAEPFEYITGRVCFYHCDIHLTTDVLIPRPETEILVDLACKKLKTKDLRGKIAWDLCTGSGCIGIAVKKSLPDLEMVLSDVSEAALGVAGKNAQVNQVKVELVQGDFLKPFEGRKADFIFCNPPYIAFKEYLGLDRSVREFEPKGALVGGEDGLEFYRRLKEGLPAHLNPGAQVFLEIGAGQGQALLGLFSCQGWKEVGIEKDWAGHDRFVFFERVI